MLREGVTVCDVTEEMIGKNMDTVTGSVCVVVVIIPVMRSEQKHAH